MGLLWRFLFLGVLFHRLPFVLKGTQKGIPIVNTLPQHISASAFARGEDAHAAP